MVPRSTGTYRVRARGADSAAACADPALRGELQIIDTSANGDGEAGLIDEVLSDMLNSAGTGAAHATDAAGMAAAPPRARWWC